MAAWRLLHRCKSLPVSWHTNRNASQPRIFQASLGCMLLGWPMPRLYGDARVLRISGRTMPGTAAKLSTARLHCVGSATRLLPGLIPSCCNILRKPWKCSNPRSSTQALAGFAASALGHVSRPLVIVDRSSKATTSGEADLATNLCATKNVQHRQLSTSVDQASALQGEAPLAASELQHSSPGSFQDPAGAHHRFASNSGLREDGEDPPTQQQLQRSSGSNLKVIRWDDLDSTPGWSDAEQQIDRYGGREVSSSSGAARPPLLSQEAGGPLTDTGLQTDGDSSFNNAAQSNGGYPSIHPSNRDPQVDRGPPSNNGPPSTRGSSVGALDLFNELHSDGVNHNQLGTGQPRWQHQQEHFESRQNSRQHRDGQVGSGTRRQESRQASMQNLLQSSWRPDVVQEFGDGAGEHRQQDIRPDSRQEHSRDKIGEYSRDSRQDVRQSSTQEHRQDVRQEYYQDSRQEYGHDYRQEYGQSYRQDARQGSGQEHRQASRRESRQEHAQGYRQEYSRDSRADPRQEHRQEHQHISRQGYGQDPKQGSRLEYRQEHDQDYRQVGSTHDGQGRQRRTHLDEDAPGPSTSTTRNLPHSIRNMYAITADRYERSPDKHDGPAGRYNNVADKYGSSANRYDSSVGRYDNAIGNYGSSASRYDGPTGRYDSLDGRYDRADTTTRFDDNEVRQSSPAPREAPLTPAGRIVGTRVERTSPEMHWNSKRGTSASKSEGSGRPSLRERQRGSNRALAAKGIQYGQRRTAQSEQGDDMRMMPAADKMRAAAMSSRVKMVYNPTRSAQALFDSEPAPRGKMDPKERAQKLKAMVDDLDDLDAIQDEGEVVSVPLPEVQAPPRVKHRAPNTGPPPHADQEEFIRVFGDKLKTYVPLSPYNNTGPRLDRNKLDWFVGYVESQQSFYVQQDGTPYFHLYHLSHEDRILTKVQDFLGFPTVKNHTITIAKPDHIYALIHLFNGNLILVANRKRFKSWVETFAALHPELAMPEIRSDAGWTPTKRNAWFSGIVDGDLARFDARDEYVETNPMYTKNYGTFTLTSTDIQLIGIVHRMFKRSVVTKKGDVYTLKIDGEPEEFVQIVRYFHAMKLQGFKQLSFKRWERMVMYPIGTVCEMADFKKNPKRLAKKLLVNAKRVSSIRHGEDVRYQRLELIKQGRYEEAAALRESKLEKRTVRIDERHYKLCEAGGEDKRKGIHWIIIPASGDKQDTGEVVKMSSDGNDADDPPLASSDDECEVVPDSVLKEADVDGEKDEDVEVVEKGTVVMKSSRTADRSDPDLSKLDAYKDTKWRQKVEKKRQEKRRAKGRSRQR